VAVFRDTEHLYRVMGALMERVRAEPELSGELAKSNLVVRYVFTEPEGTITVDLRGEPIGFTIGPSDLRPDVEFMQTGDVAHQFWLGKLSAPRAIATRKVISRGSVTKALQLLPAVKPVFAVYPEVLREIGEEALIPRETTRSRGRRWRIRVPRGRRGYRIEVMPSLTIPMTEGEPDQEITPHAAALPADQDALKVEMLRRMLLIRAFEERLAAEFASGAIPAGALHLSLGQEACAVGACFALAESDYMATTHRGHGHMLARGADVGSMAAEIFGKGSGLCGGLGGPMHVTDARLGALGANGIVGASALVAIGGAMSARMRKTGQVALAFAGDGATAQGMFHEALNFAAVFSLPAVFFVENNQYAEFTPQRGHSRVGHLADRAAGHGLRGVTVDGNDVWSVYEAVREAVGRARRGEGPTLVEGLTYRTSGHAEGESACYRSEEEVEAWRARDPIVRWRDHLIGAGMISAEQAARMEREAQTAAGQAIDLAAHGPEPDPASAERLVFAPEPAVLYRDEPCPKADREITVSAALTEALAEELERDDRVYLIGEDVRAGAYFGVTAGLAEKFGQGRIIDTPISEYAIVGSSVGAAMTGMRPVAEIQFADFITCCMDPLVNQAAKLRLMSGGQYRLPLVVRAPGGAGAGMAAQHSQSLEAWLLHVPGLIVIAPGTAFDAKGLLKAAIRSNNPVVFFENKLLYAATGPVPSREFLVPIGKADVKRAGNDVTVVAVGAMVGPALEAADLLTADGIDVEVVDPRTLAPCDWPAIVSSAAKTGRAVVVEAGALTGGFGAEAAARITQGAWGALRGPVRRVAARDVPIPYNRSLEDAVIPDVDQITAAVLAALRR
jgi:2-oxoisovalerate dehydrogenase E1 component